MVDRFLVCLIVCLIFLRFLVFFAGLGLRAIPCPGALPLALVCMRRVRITFSSSRASLTKGEGEVRDKWDG